MLTTFKHITITTIVCALLASLTLNYFFYTGALTKLEPATGDMLADMKPVHLSRK